ncbi:MAG TPA: hypothetical protein VFO07_07785 [Roseiflexaceae bacterium]|nr:hypothetical protein [Roseiflexaceae bacterium]
MSKPKIPLPILLYGFVLAAIAAVGGISLYANIGGAFPGLRLEGTSLQSGYMYAGRTLTMAVMLVLALSLGEARGVLFVFVMRLLVDAQDLFATLISGASTLNPLFTIALYLCALLIPETLVIRWAWRTMRSTNTQPGAGIASRERA